MKSEELKRAILQHLLKHQDEWTPGPTMDSLFSCSDRQRKAAIESLHFDAFPILAHEDKTKGYKISYDVNECRAYYDRCEKEIKVRLASIKTMRALVESGELFAQPQVIENLIEKEMEEING
jgi:hypothetical protein